MPAKRRRVTIHTCEGTQVYAYYDPAGPSYPEDGVVVYNGLARWQVNAHAISTKDVGEIEFDEI